MGQHENCVKSGLERRERYGEGCYATTVTQRARKICIGWPCADKERFMQRSLAFLSTAALVAVYAACAPKPIPFHQMRTPSGDFCSDMPIHAGRDQPDKEFHRLGPVKSGANFKTVAERLESLRKAACEAEADAVIEASEDEVRQVDGTYGKVASGTAVIWTRRVDEEGRPLGLGSVTGKKPEGVFKEDAAPEPTAKDPTPLNTGVEVKSPPPAPTPSVTAEATATATATSAPATTTTTKTTTKTKTKK